MNFEEHGEVSWVMKEDLFSGTYVYVCIHTYIRTYSAYSRTSLRQTLLRQISAQYKPIFEHYLVCCSSVHVVSKS